jgi:prepilin-type N-terminal cleavage/methylation domain-containing protein
LPQNRLDGRVRYPGTGDLMKSRRAFTLVELLIVIAIIALLFGMLLPVLSSLDFLKKDTACRKNLKDIYKILTAYTGMNGGRYPYPIDTYYGRSFSGPAVPKDLWAGLPQLNQLKQVGAKAEMFHCPFDATYGDWTVWPNSTWERPHSYDSNGQQKVVVYFGYSFFTYRSYPYNNSRFSDGRSPIISDSGDDDIPIVADSLFTRLSGQIKWGWYHNGGLPDGLFNAGGNTLFKGGAVVSMSASDFDWDDPSFTIGSATDLWWCALSDDL